MTEKLSASSGTSVVVCTRNRGARVTMAIDSILASSFPEFELIVIDQSTDDQSRRALERFTDDPRFRYVASSETGLGRARNTGLREARGSIILFTDDDCTVPPTWISTMVDSFERSPRIAVVFSNVTAPDYDRNAGFVPTYSRSDSTLMTSAAQKCRGRGIGASLGVRRRAMEAIGGFDSRLGAGAQFPAAEDSDIAVRALLNGWYVYETADTEVLHDGFRTWDEGRALLRQSWTGIGASFVKPLRARHWRFAPAVLHESFVVALGHALKPVVELRRPKGLKSFWWFWHGFFAGLHVPLDRRHMLFREAPAATEARSDSDVSVPSMGRPGPRDRPGGTAPGGLPDEWKEPSAQATGVL
jgi:glycosyltransferase involved in cell wall biosynthesis